MIDLKANVLRIGSEAVQFLSGKDVEGAGFNGPGFEASLPPPLPRPGHQPLNAANASPPDLASRGASVGRREIDELKIKQYVSVEWEYYSLTDRLTDRLADIV